jgi:hypothetical protein
VHSLPQDGSLGRPQLALVLDELGDAVVWKAAENGLPARALRTQKLQECRTLDKKFSIRCMEAQVRPEYIVQVVSADNKRP